VVEPTHYEKYANVKLDHFPNFPVNMQNIEKHHHPDDVFDI